MRALLISANTEKIPDPVYPIGPACVGAAARRAGHDVEAVDLVLRGRCSRARHRTPSVTSRPTWSESRCATSTIPPIRRTAPTSTTIARSCRGYERRAALPWCSAARASRSCRPRSWRSCMPTTGWSARGSTRSLGCSARSRIAGRFVGSASFACERVNGGAAGFVDPTDRAARCRPSARSRPLRRSALLRARRLHERADQARVLLRLRVLQLSVDRRHEGPRAQRRAGRRRDRGVCASLRRTPHLLRRQHLQFSVATRQAGLRGNRSSRARRRVVRLSEPALRGRRARPEDGRVGLQGRRVRHRFRRGDDDREPAQRVRRRGSTPVEPALSPVRHQVRSQPHFRGPRRDVANHRRDPRR